MPGMQMRFVPLNQEQAVVLSRLDKSDVRAKILYNYNPLGSLKIFNANGIQFGGC